MDRIEKALEKLAARERAQIKDILQKLQKRQTAGLDIKKLKGRDDIFRVRKGDIRAIYRTDKMRRIFVLRIDRRDKSTYKL